VAHRDGRQHDGIDPAEEGIAVEVGGEQRRIATLRTVAQSLLHRGRQRFERPLREVLGVPRRAGVRQRHDDKGPRAVGRLQCRGGFVGAPFLAIPGDIGVEQHLPVEHHGHGVRRVVGITRRQPDFDRACRNRACCRQGEPLQSAVGSGG